MMTNPVVLSYRMHDLLSVLTVFSNVNPQNFINRFISERGSYDDYAAADGDVLTKELPPLMDRKPSFAVWQP